MSLALAGSLLLLAAASMLQAQEAPPADAPPRRIRDIRVEGVQTSSPSAVITISGLRIGDMVTSTTDAFAKAIRNLVDRRLFSDVRVYAENVTATDLVVVIAVKEYQRVGAVRFAGNEDQSDKDLTDLLTIRPGDIAVPYEMDRTRAKIRKKYSDEGYLFTKVNVTQSPSADTGRVDLLFTVEEGPEVRIGSITFEGNRAISESDLRGAMDKIKEKSWWQFWRSSKFDRTQLKDDEKKIVAYYHARGYIDADVVRDSIGINPATGHADVHIVVTEGHKVYLRNLTIAGNSVYSDEQIRRRLDVEPGGPYNQVQLESNLKGNEEQTDVRSLYLDNGYLTFDARMEEKRVGADSVDVVVRMQEGGQSSIRYVSIAGNTKTRDKVIRRELYTRPGDTFSKAAVIRSLRNLANLNYFNPERLQPDVQPVDATSVDITYQVEERPSDTFNASLGLSSQGLTGMLGVSFNNFSILEPLNGGSGQVLNFNWEFGSFVNTLLLGFTEPWLFDDPTSLGASISLQTRSYDPGNGSPGFQLRQVGGGINIGRRLSWPDDYFRVDAGINLRSNKLEGDASLDPYYRNGTEFSLTLSLSRASIDNPIFPTMGSRFSFVNTIAGLGDAKYTKHELKFDFFSPLAQLSESNPLVLYIGNEYGYLNDYGPIEGIPPSAFYSMGGTGIGGFNTTPLRGYKDQSIGPVSSVPIGKLYTKITSELRFGIAVNPIPIYALAFAEAGNVWNNFREVDPFDLKRSMGLGIRLTIPGVGLLGFDYGYGFDLDNLGEKGGWQFHFQFGR
ncbi:MAG TPA: outer membrane protein assembly factor BamA [Candidatus Kapabacteria bacterium]|nr:outer membrane protein assembly factor BamA [Candidatus Kapabacteria bacterium]